MNEFAEQADSPSDQQPPSWIWHYHPWSCVTIELKTPSEGTLTTAELCQHIRSLQETPNRIVVRWGESAVCSDSDLKSLGNAMHGLQPFRELCIRGAWTDEKASVFLRHVAKTSFRTLVIAIGRQLRILSVLAESQGFPFLRTLELWRAKLDKDDCRSLEQVLQGHHHREDFTIEFYSCSFPSFKGYFVVADAAIHTGCRLYFGIDNNVGDVSIRDSASDSSTMNGESHRTFYNIYERNKFFAQAANKHMDRYNGLNRAGRWKLLRNKQKPTVRQCVDVLCHDTVRNCADYLFHFITMNPDVYAAAAVKND